MEGIPSRPYGCQGMTRPLRRVLVKRPAPADLDAWREYGWRAAPDPARLHEGKDLSLKGDGGPTCLTRPILRR